MLNQDLIDVLACPKCKNGVILSDDGLFLICEACGLAYPINENIPAMLIDMAVPLNSVKDKIK